MEMSGGRVYDGEKEGGEKIWWYSDIGIWYKY